MSEWEDDRSFDRRTRDLEERLRRRHGRRRRRQRREDLTPEERLLREAERRAERKLAFVRHFIAYVLVVCGLYLATRSPFVAGMVAVFWGIGMWSHFFQAIVGPELRKRWIQSEVERDVRRAVTRERRVLSDQKTRSLEQLSASIAHEIRNPITAAKSLVQQMGEDPGSRENVEYAKVALEELDRVERSISHLLRYAREEEVTLKSMRLAEALEAALETLRDRIQKLGVEIAREYDSDGEIDGDSEKIRRVFINLIANALDAFEEHKTHEPRLELSIGANLAGSEIWARVKDNGPGMDAETQEKVFQMFFTSKRGGTGLGLAITRKMVEAHGGTIDVESAPGQGTSFELSFPKQPEIGGNP
jgi:signal transduction histidine kinase